MINCDVKQSSINKTGDVVEQHKTSVRHMTAASSGIFLYVWYGMVSYGMVWYGVWCRHAVSYSEYVFPYGQRLSGVAYAATGGRSG